MTISTEQLEQRHANFRRELEHNITTYGHSVLGVFATQPGERSFCYSIGLNDCGWPEVIIMGISTHSGGQLINNLVAECRRRERSPQVGEVFTQLANLPLGVGQCGPAAVEEYLCQAVGRADRQGRPAVTAVQLVMSDRAGLLPDHTRYDRGYMDPRQPCLSPTGSWDSFAAGSVL